MSYLQNWPPTTHQSVSPSDRPLFVGQPVGVFVSFRHRNTRSVATALSAKTGKTGRKENKIKTCKLLYSGPKITLTRLLQWPGGLKCLPVISYFTVSKCMNVMQTE